MPRLRKSSTVLTNDQEALAAATAVYPRFVIRLIPTVYVYATVEYTNDPLGAGLHNGYRIVRVFDPEPDAGSDLTPKRSLAIERLARELSDSTGFSMCAVFAPKDAYYTWPGGKDSRSSPPSKGGLCLYDVRDPRTEGKVEDGNAPDTGQKPLEH